MTAPTRFLDQSNSDAEKIIALAAAVPPRALTHDDWDTVMARAVTSRPSAWKHVPAFALSLAVGIVLVLVLRPSPVVALRAPELVATANARWSHVAPGEVSLQAGRLAVSRPGDAPIRVQTPDVVLETVRSRFLAEVTVNGTTVVVEEGEVIVRARGKEHVVHAGESFTWPPPPEIPEQLLDAPTTTGAHCTGLSGAALSSCLSNESQGSTLDAQAALYELGALQAKSGDRSAAMTTWKSSLERFADGVLEPEVRIAMLVELVKARRTAEAIAAAKEFEAAFPADARVKNVAALRESMER